MLPKSIRAIDEEYICTNDRLVLIGTVHSDPEGYERALRLLKRLRPELITVEISAFSVRYRAAHGARWRRLFEAAVAGLPEGARRHPALVRMAAQIDMPFEWRAAHAYGHTHGVPWRPVDLSIQARQHLPLYSGELLDSKNLRRLWETTEAPLEEQVAADYRRARLSELKPLWRPPIGGDGLTWLRERTMAARLRRLAGQGRRLAHLGGWEHQVFWEDGGGLTEMLKDLQPLCLWLDEGEGPAQVKTPVPPGFALATEASSKWRCVGCALRTRTR